MNKVVLLQAEGSIVNLQGETQTSTLNVLVTF